MRKAFTLLMCFAVVPAATLLAQLPSIGIRGAANWATLTNVVEKGQSRLWPVTPGFGIVGRLRFDELLVKTELNYEKKGFKVDIGHGDNTYERITATYFEMPIMLEFSPYSTPDFNVYVEWGVFISYWYSGTYELSDTAGGQVVVSQKDIDLFRPDTKHLYNEYDGGMTLGAGLSKSIAGGSHEVYLGVRGSFGFIDAMRYTGTTTSSRIDGCKNFVMSATLGYYINHFDNKSRKFRMRKGPYY